MDASRVLTLPVFGRAARSDFRNVQLHPIPLAGMVNKMVSYGAVPHRDRPHPLHADSEEDHPHEADGVGTIAFRFV